MTLVVSQNNPEVLWNAFRFGNLLLNEGDEVKIFSQRPGRGVWKPGLRGLSPWPFWPRPLS